MNTYRFSFFQRFVKKQYFGLWIFLLIILIFTIEIFIYHANTSTWLELKCDNEEDCTRILLVADPQLIGERNEMIHFITPLSIKDDDEYLKKTFNLAFKFVQPDVVIYLGDLLDEGSIATNEEFDRYVKRFFNIFNDKSNPSVTHIWLPGDNDIGGDEWKDDVTVEKVERFEKAFAQPEVFAHKHVKFFKINCLTQKYGKFDEKRDFYDSSTVFVGLSHMPVVDHPTSFVDKVLNATKPHVVFTGHRHKSMILNAHPFEQRECKVIPVLHEHNAVYEYTLGKNFVYEIVVPTCTYRMNTDKIGYGFAIIEKNKIRYTVLWSPSRFKQIFIYLIFITCLVVLGVCLRFCVRSNVKTKNL